MKSINYQKINDQTKKIRFEFGFIAYILYEKDNTGRVELEKSTLDYFLSSIPKWISRLIYLSSILSTCL